eukprot:6209375-Pleurochrysis_carterae.AAC.3
MPEIVRTSSFLSQESYEKIPPILANAKNDSRERGSKEYGSKEQPREGEEREGETGKREDVVGRGKCNRERVQSTHSKVARQREGRVKKEISLACTPANRKETRAGGKHPERKEGAWHGAGSKWSYMRK